MSPAAAPGTRPTTRMPSRKALATTIVIAAAAGAWAGNRLRQIPVTRPETEARPLVDWRRAREIAVAMSREDVLSMPERRKLDAEFRELVRHCVPIVSAYTGDTLPDAPERTFAFDRVDWVNANIDAFEAMFVPLEGLNLLGDAAEPHRGRGVDGNGQPEGAQRGSGPASRLPGAQGAGAVRPHPARA